MGFYSERVLPWAMEKGMSIPDVLEQRRAALAEARGAVLEIGFGFGGTIAAYRSGPEGIASLTGLEPSRGMVRRAIPKLRGAPFAIRLVLAGAEAIPFVRESFDTVVSTYTLCSIPRLTEALAEIRRVLKPEGRFLFLEHGRAEDPRLARWQRRLNPIHGIYAGGCKLDLPVDQLVRDGRFAIEKLERYEAPSMPRIGGQMYRGSARPLRA